MGKQTSQINHMSKNHVIHLHVDWLCQTGMLVWHPSHVFDRMQLLAEICQQPYLPSSWETIGEYLMALLPLFFTIDSMRSFNKN
jgi:hypothetical protein